MTETSQPQPPQPDPHEALDALLTDVVTTLVADQDARPRPGQAALAHDVLDVMLAPGGQVAGAAPTGVGKSLSYGAPAVLRAVSDGERTVISTESLALQAQIVDKDLPRVVDSALNLFGVRPDVAVLMGWSNYTCAAAAVSIAQSMLGLPASKAVTQEGILALADQVNTLSGMVEVDGAQVPAVDVVPVVAWALRQHVDSELTGAAHASAQVSTGSRHTYPDKVADLVWGQVSVSPAECVGVGQCPLADLCKPEAAKQRAAAADIVVTNHSMLATQAANDISVVVGSRKLGRFDHIVVDEAHTLPNQVRSQGAKEVSGRRVLGVVRALRSVLDDRDPSTRGLLDAGEQVAQIVQDELAGQMAAGTVTKMHPVLRLNEGDDPIRGTGAMLETWLDRAAKALGAAAVRATGDTEMKVRRVKGRIDNLKADTRSVADHRTGVARWVETGQPDRVGRSWSAAKSSPVEVGGMLAGTLWTAPMPTSDEADELDDQVTDPAARGEERYDLSVVAVSATLPNGFSREMGMRAQPGAYPSPFEVAYGSSALFVPRAADPDDIAALASPWGPPTKPKFDTKRHVDWALPHLAALVEANQGSALILAATASAGRRYAEHLRAHSRGRWEVMDQWSGDALRRTTDAWREDHQSVLVGTRSLMTGIDAPGDTCSLVVLDRIPRAAGNPVDDARVESLMARLETDKWSADRMVYSSDAALLVEQAAGRLIRSMSDSGMVAVLDPRLLKIGPYRYQEQTRQVYMKALSRFERKISNLDEAVQFLRAQHGSAAAVAA